MSTNGAIGFILDDQEYITYNHSDSYPSELGVDVLKFTEAISATPGSLDEAKEQVRNLKVVDDSIKPTSDDVEALSGTTNLNVSTGTTEEWYTLLRETQGNLQAILDCGYMEDWHEWPLDSLSCEWAYLINFDTGFLEVYEGFQSEPHDHGRFAHRQIPPTWSTSHYPVALVQAWSLGELPSEEQFQKVLPD